MGTFGSFGTVRLGIYAAQKGLDVTGNNITNINTEGYTRQRLNQVSLIPSVCDRYQYSQAVVGETVEPRPSLVQNGRLLPEIIIFFQRFPVFCHSVLSSCKFILKRI